MVGAAVRRCRKTFQFPSGDVGPYKGARERDVAVCVQTVVENVIVFERGAIALRFSACQWQMEFLASLINLFKKKKKKEKKLSR